MRPITRKPSEYQSFTCKECNKIEENHWINWKQLFDNKLCQNCFFWQKKIDIEINPSTRDKVVRIDGVHYFIGQEPRLPFRDLDCLGFGGREFRIKFLDGREIITHNLWCQGEIPERFKERLPDNAEFLPNLKWVEINETKLLLKTS